MPPGPNAACRPIPCALPLEEALDWSTFATLADVYDLKGLDEQLKCLLPKVRRGCAAGRGEKGGVCCSNVSGLGQALCTVANLPAVHCLAPLTANPPVRMWINDRWPRHSLLQPA